MKKVLWNILVILYVLVAIFTTLCLLNYNDYKVTEFGETTLVLITDDKIGDYKKGDLVLAKKGSLASAEAGDNIFFYNDDQIRYSKLERVSRAYEGMDATFTIEGGYQFVESEGIGTAKDAKAIGGVGSILSLLESKWGFLFLIIFPSLLAFLNEVVQVIAELKTNSYPEKDDRRGRSNSRKRSTKEE